MHRRRTSPARRAGRTALAVTALALLLASCSPTPGPSAEPTGTETGPVATPTEVVPVYEPDGTAQDNLPVFTLVTQQVWASDQRGAGRAYIDALVAAGFDKSAMQVTEDNSTVGRAAESMQFSVRWGDTECLIGQVGPSTGEPVTKVMQQLVDGRCLIGQTRPIDW